jgi:ABC-type Mn2+/Zn2+ transport system permease subunit
MFEALREILAPDFLLRNSIYVTLLVGLACPIIGCFLILRRLIFLGVALPQVASAGVALTMSLHIWIGSESMFHFFTESPLTGSIVFTFVTIVALAIIERFGRSAGEGGLGALYVLTTAAAILILAKCPTAEQSWLSLFKGEIVSVGTRDVVITGASFGIALLLLTVFAKEILLVSFDREMAITLRKNVFVWDLLLYLLIGLVIAVAVLTVGPLVTFGFLVIPPLIIHPWAGNMRRFFILSGVLGMIASFLGFWIAYHEDLPVGPTDVALLGVLLGVSRALRKLLRL